MTVEQRLLWFCVGFVVCLLWQRALAPGRAARREPLALKRRAG